MTDDPTTRGEAPAAPDHDGDAAAASGGEMQQLREMIVGPAQRRIDEIDHRLDDPAQRTREVSRVLAEATTMRIAADRKLEQALEPVVEGSLRDSVKKNPRAIADAIFPIMGPAIRRAIAETFARMLGSLSQALEHSFSIHALKWRLEGWRTGKSFAEVVMLHTLLYRVEQVYLIHRKTGLLLQHVAGPSVDVRDGDMVSGMLTAIRDFVGDSFQVGEGEALDSLRVGELTVWIEAGPNAVLAAVIRGTPPSHLRDDLQVTLERIHAEFAGELADFEGDAAPFELCRPLLESCLGEAKRSTEKRTPWLGWAVVGAVAILLALWIGFAMRDAHRWRAFVDHLRHQPGIVVTTAERRGDGGVIYGLRDPLAAKSDALVADFAGDPADIDLQLKPYADTTPDFVQRRAVERLDPPPSVHVTFADGQLTLAGSATQAWVTRARRLAPGIAGVTRIDDAHLTATDANQLAMDRIRDLLRPPASVQLTLEGNTLHAAGAAPAHWITQAQDRVGLLDGVAHFDTQHLAVADRDEALFRQINLRLEPPASVVLSLNDGVLTARGSAPTKWIADARLLVRTLPDIDSYRDDQLTASDRDQVTLDRARDLLHPPAGVQLAVFGDTLTAAGSAPQAWIDRARVLASAVEGITSFNDHQLTSTDGRALLMQRISATLRPPDSVHLTLTGDTLAASGEASSKWLHDARILVRVLPDVAHYDDSAVRDTDHDRELLAAARLALHPPVSVQLAVSGDTLKATGSADAAWVIPARAAAVNIPGVAHYDDAALVAAAQQRLAAARNRIDNCTVYFNRSTIEVLEGQNAKISALLNDIRTALDAGEIIGRPVHIEVIGHTDNVSAQDQNLILSASRCDKINQMLVLGGIDDARLKDRPVGSAGQPNTVMSEDEKAQHRCVTFHVIDAPK